jgi:DNA processing protein
MGSQRMRMLKHVTGSYVKALSAKRPLLQQAGMRASTIERFLAWRKSYDEGEIIDALDAKGIRVLFSEDSDFSPLLATSNDPPEVLFVPGTIPSAPAVAIVGTRKITPYGEQVVRHLVLPLVRTGLCVVSGLALGVDGLVHRATLDAGGITAAFLATGVDHSSIYPRAHVRLAEEIVEKGGCLLSESPPGGQGHEYLFPLRNRLIASFSLATVIVEAAPKSGSLITATLALEENREVLAVPGSIWNPQSEGTNHLLKLGAKPCTSAQDILDALALDRPDLMAQARSELPTTPQDQMFLSYLSQPIHIDVLATLAKQAVSHVSSQLSILELKGLVQHLGGQTWVRA